MPKWRSDTMPERVHQVQAGLRVSDSRGLTDFCIAASSDIWAPSTNLCAPSTKWCAPGSSTDRWTLQVQTRPWPGHQRCNWRLSPRAHVIYVLVWETQRAARDPKIGQRVAIYIGCHISRFYDKIRVKKRVMIFLALIVNDSAHFANFIQWC